MAQTIFNQGDVVKLISGGPVMTVSNVAQGIVKCVWYDGYANKFDHITVSPMVLTKTTVLTPGGPGGKSPFGSQH